MKYSIEWTTEAEITYDEIIFSIEQKWTQREVVIFIKRTEEVLNYIKQNPTLYPFSKKSKIHRAVVSSQTNLYYEVKHDRIILLSFWINRKNPKKLKY